MITKKNLLAFATLVVLTTFVFAQDASSDVGLSSGGNESSNSDVLSNEDLNLDLEGLDSGPGTDSSSKWGYNPNVVIEIKDVTPTSITIVSPTVNDGNGQVVKRYKVTYGSNHINESSPTDLKEQSFDFEDVTGSTVSLTISGLDTTKPYYFVIQPLNKDNIAGENSSEISYSPEQHSAPSSQTTSSQTTLGGVSEEINANKVTLKWTPLDGASKVRVSVKKLEEGVNTEFELKGEPKMTDATYSFEVTSTGEYLVNLLPINDNGDAVGAEVIHTIKIDNIETKANIKKTPKVGPETNVIIGFMLIAILLYVVYRFRKI